MRVPPRSLAGAALVVALLALHFETRWYAAAVPMPERLRSFYSSDYQVALALAAGRGFSGFDLDGDPREEANAVRHFFRFRRHALPASALTRFAVGAPAAPAPAPASTRILELR